ncbi:MAG: YfiR family protein [Roseateles sp.]|uniref:YfiR family protein n=1 Tax=Roseateles sp. TaxID=1971397 RepID=UPI004036D3B6
MAPALLARRKLLLAGLAAFAGPAPSRAGDENLVEYQVKAAFVCKFCNYVEWPTQVMGGAGAPLRIGVLGGETVLEEFRRTAAASSVSGRPIEVRRLLRPELPDGLHAVFVTRAMSAHAESIVAAARGRPVLTITEFDASASAGMVNFIVVNDKVRFDILLPAVSQSGLKISARLLGVARRVEGR